jgi:GT2 family glycosyltransferase
MPAEEPSPPLPAATFDWAVVVVNRDGGEMLGEALRSIDLQSAPPAERILVDNGSKPEERRRIRERFPLWKLVEVEGNGGFAWGSNRGIAESSAPWIALVNNDVVLDAEWGERLLDRARTDEANPVERRFLPGQPERPVPLAALQGAVLRWNGGEVDTLGITLDDAVAAIPVGAGTPAGNILRSGHFEIRGPSATAALYRRESLIAAAGAAGEVFPPAFFAWYEDVDLGFRFWRLGQRVLCEPKAVARHRGSVTGDRSPALRRMLIARNRRWALLRNLSEDALRVFAEPIARGTRRSVTTAVAEASFAGLRGAIAGVRDRSEPPSDPIDAPKLSTWEVEREIVRGRSLTR